jgi:Orsellinic acid/F9775 biosynthesis cluster protein D
MSTPTTSSLVPMEPVIKFLPSYRVLLCTACSKSTCIPSNGIIIHLRNFHKDQFTRKQRTQLANEARRHPALPPQSVELPHREDGPVPGLHIHDGWECTQCQYVCGSENTMKKHVRTKHGWVKSIPKIWRKQSIQVNHSHYDFSIVLTMTVLLLHFQIPQVFPCRSNFTTASDPSRRRHH